MINHQIIRAHPGDLDACLRVLASSVQAMHSRGFMQWNNQYPNRRILLGDIRAGSLYVVRADGAIAGFAAFDQNQSPEYSAIDFQYPLPAMIVHRLCIDPAYQRKGLARELMLFALSHARKLGCRCIRLDTRADNHAALALYEKLGFQIRGHVHFPRCPEYEFPCMEIDLTE